MKNIDIVYRAGKENANADALYRSPHGVPPPNPTVEGMQVGRIDSIDVPEDIRELLGVEPFSQTSSNTDFSAEQGKDIVLKAMMDHLRDGSLPGDDQAARKLVMQSPLFALVDGILYYVNPKQEVVPNHKSCT